MGAVYELKQFNAGSCYSYIVSSRGEAVIVDPHISLFDAYSSYLEKNRLSLKYIIDTHTHADHFSLAAVLKKKFGASLVMHEKAVSAIVNRRVRSGDELKLGDLVMRFMSVPGHTDDSMAVLLPDAVLTGDVLLIGSVGRTDFQNGSPESMFETLQELKKLPGETKVYPAHDYHGKRSSTIGREISSNPFMKATDKDAFVRDMRRKELAKPFNIDNIIRVNQTGQAAELVMISPKDASALNNGDGEVKFLDVRSPGEYAEVHIDGSINIPMDILAGRVGELGNSGKKYIVLCRTGTRSAMAADMLLQSGVHGVKVLDGGMTRWEKERLPVVKGQKTFTLERQVRIAAGSFVLAGLLLSWFVHPYFIAIPLFVSCGLIYSGITDNCMMAMVLMKLPYNRKLFKSQSGGTCAMG
ncbi:MAG: MBL fold metallo-hydrolase [Candidatus Omnitrophica bacterium]|nr:MBL fold metallo-hydrolase [Candidatus Omnitrophota bacterium]